MSKITTTLYEIIYSELVNDGKNEFFNNNQITFFDKNYSFLRKMSKYDDDVHKVVTDMFFNSFELSDLVIDKRFKRAFVNKFMNREIKYQTVETFASHLVYETLVLEDYIINAYKNVNSFMNNEGKNTTKGDTGRVSDNRSMVNSLPQNQINMDLNDDEMDYADTNTSSKSKDETTNNSVGNTTNFNIANMKATQNILSEIFDILDVKCFLQRW